MVNLMGKPFIHDGTIEEIGKLFGAMSDVSRLRILRVLLDAPEPLHQGAIAAQTGLSQANASKHLAFLAQVGLVIREPRGVMVYFRPVVPIVKDVCGVMSDFVAQRIQSAYRSLS